MNAAVTCVQTPSRDLMLNDFFVKKTLMVTVMKNIEDLEKLKRSDLHAWAVDMCGSHKWQILPWDVRHLWYVQRW